VYFNYLPSAKCETLEFLYVSKADQITNKTTKNLFCYNPETTVVTESAIGDLNEANIDLPPNTIIANSYSYKFNNEITVQIVDTSPAYCVIIKCNEKLVLIPYGNNGDLSSLFDTYGKPDILILSKDLPKSIPDNIETLIFSNDSDIILNENIDTLKKQCKKFHTTAENGDIKIIL
jgi:hypothetical protein